MNHLSYFAGCYTALIGKDDEFNEWVIGQCRQQKDIVDNDAIEQFFEDLMVLQQENRLGSDVVEMSSGKVYIWLKTAYEQWRDRFARHKEIHAYPVFRKTILNRPYTEGEERYYFKNSRQRAVVFSHDKSPESLRDLGEVFKREEL